MSVNPEMREERRVVTALSADLVGSTAITEALDPEEARLVVGEAVGRMVHAVEEFGGTVKDLAGDGILALFGAPTAHEDDPERALRAALRITEDVREFARDVERSFAVEGFAVRVGVNTGAVVVGPVGAGSRVEYGATGDAVNVAARLQSAAEPGGVLAGAETRRLAERQFTWGDRQSLTLKGKADAVAAWTVEGATSPGREAIDSPLVGREPELAAAMQALDDVAGRRRLDPLHLGRARDRQEPLPGRAPPPRTRADVARGPLRLVRRVDAVLAVPRPPARLARPRPRRSRAAHPPLAAARAQPARTARAPTTTTRTSRRCSA